MPTQVLSEKKSVSSPGLELPKTPSSHKPQRIAALDFTKGALVLIMVLYHWINYFIGPQWEYYTYLRFLTPSFIFMAGFMISNVYLTKYSASDPRLAKRLFTRGLKLMAIFVALNVARTTVVPILGTGTLANDPLSLTNLFTIFVSGNLPVTGGKLISFSILVPISYLLMFSGILMLPHRRYNYTFHLVCGLLLSSSLILGFVGARSYNLEFVTIGMLGVVTGFMPMPVIDKFVRHPYRLALAYACYAAAITVWNVPFVLLVAGVFLSLMAIYLVGATGSESGIVRHEFILLGKYSLFGYISQMVILQMLILAFRRMDPGLGALVLSFSAAFVLTIASVEVVDRARAKVARVDKLYKAVFA